MTIGAAFWQMSVIARELTRVEKSFVAVFLENDDGGDARGQTEKADEKEAQSSRVDPTVESKIILISPCDLLLGVFRLIHWQLKVIS